MTQRIILALAAILTIFSGRAEIYLNAAATGGEDGTFDGSSWSKAYKTLPEAMGALASCEDRTLRVAKGVYFVGSSAPFTVTDKAVIVGGYLGETDGDLTRDPDANETIFSGLDNSVANKGVNTVVWKHVVPTLGGFSMASETTTEKIIVDGRLNLPAPTGDYDAYYAGSDEGKRGLVVAANAELSVDGVRFVCMGYDNTIGGAAIRADDGAKKVSLSGCVFAGGWKLRNAMVNVGPTVEASVITNCAFFYNGNSNNSGPHLNVRASASMTVDGCRFVGGIMLTDTASGSGLGMSAGVLRNSLVTHNLAARGNTNYKAPLIGLTDAIMENCVISNNFTATKKTAIYCGSPLLEMKGATVRNTLFANNRSEFNALDGKAYTMIGYHYAYEKGDYGGTINNCLFVGNTVSVPSVECLSGSYAVGLIGCVWDGENVTVVGRDCVVNCQFEGNDATCASVDGVTPTLCRGVLSRQCGGNMQTAVSNCTFVAAAGAGGKDVAIYSTKSPYAKAFCDVVNSLFLRTDDGVAEDAVFASANGTKLSVLDCTIQNLFGQTAQGGVTVSAGLYCDKVPFVRVPYLFGGEATDCGWLKPSANTPGILETTDGSVRGAVNGLTPTAANGRTLTVRRMPLAAGTVDLSAQAVATGTAISPVTASPAEGFAFKGWYLEDGVTPSGYEGNPLNIAALTDDLVLAAVFEAGGKTQITFDLGSYGVFVDSGESTAVVEASAMDPFPEVPAYRVAEGYHIYKWDDFPETVPPADTTYHAYGVTKDVRTIFVSPSGTGGGTSWEDAYGSLADACADAGRYRGEVRMLSGDYVIATPVVLPCNVTVRGGFGGGMTRLTGDTGAAVAFGAFAVEEGVVTNAALANLTFDTFARMAVQVSGDPASELSISNCVFKNCAMSDDDKGASGYAAVRANGNLLLADSVFTNCKACVRSSGGTEKRVLGCLFEDNRVLGLSFGATGAQTNVLEDCVFRGNRYRNGGHSLGISSGDNRYPIVLRISDCVFEDNIGDDFVDGLVRSYAAGSCEAIVERCRFTGGRCIQTGWNDGSACSLGLSFTGNWSLLVRDTYFGGNEILYGYAAATKNKGGATAAYLATNSKDANFVNCTFESNTVTSAENRYAATICCDVEGQRLGLVNCTFVDNGVTSATEGLAADVLVNTAPTSGHPIEIVNSLLFSSAEGYVPVAPCVRVAFAWDGIQGFDAAAAEAEGAEFFGDVWTADPLFGKTKEGGPDGILARALRGQTPYARAGHSPRFPASGTAVYVKNPLTGRWRNPSGGVELTAEAAEAIGVGDATPAIPDAWGESRRLTTCALGAVNAAKSGLVILLK